MFPAKKLELQRVRSSSRIIALKAKDTKPVVENIKPRRPKPRRKPDRFSALPAELLFTIFEDLREYNSTTGRNLYTPWSKTLNSYQRISFYHEIILQGVTALGKFLTSIEASGHGHLVKVLVIELDEQDGESSRINFDLAELTPLLPNLAELDCVDSLIFGPSYVSQLDHFTKLKSVRLDIDNANDLRIILGMKGLQDIHLWMDCDSFNHGSGITDDIERLSLNSLIVEGATSAPEVLDFIRLIDATNVHLIDTDSLALFPALACVSVVTKAITLDNLYNHTSPRYLNAVLFQRLINLQHLTLLGQGLWTSSTFFPSLFEKSTTLKSLTLGSAMELFGVDLIKGLQKSPKSFTHLTVNLPPVSYRPCDFGGGRTLGVGCDQDDIVSLVELGKARGFKVHGSSFVQAGIIEGRS